MLEHAIDIAWAVAFFCALGVILFRYEESVSRREREKKAREAQADYDGYLRYAEARKAGPRDIVV